ncbi:hypothetical protein LTR62_002066 [Meristemomyces frigidus]|uniref:Matrin-type domain-containing protein n=1 Tax=Meristemomyces frigidus TaxID=1508187 RepID=A0AAN7TL93_9PEZI|nr:hypothetical protein LTR62_002066 [Meristemomyces frigidus]
MSTNWCKYCSIYVRENEQKKHEANFKHQNAVQRSLRELQKTNLRNERDTKRAKDEVARLNGIVDSKKAAEDTSAGPTISGLKVVSSREKAAPVENSAGQRKLHAEQLAALGVALPDKLKKEVTGVGNWQTVSERVVDDESASLSLAKIKAEGDSKDGPDVDSVGRGVRKRRGDDDEKEEELARRRTWGSSVKRYPGARDGDAGEDLDALLSGVGKVNSKKVKKEESGEDASVKQESVQHEPITNVVTRDEAEDEIKQEVDAIPTVVFKKRKIKR